MGALRLGVVLVELLHLSRCRVVLGLGDLPDREVQRNVLEFHDLSRAFVLRDQVENVVHRSEQTAGQFLVTLKAAETLHAYFRRLPVANVRRLVARRAANAQNDQVFAVLFLQHRAQVAPEVRVELRVVLVLLRGARDVEHHRDQLVFFVPEAENIQVRVGHPLDGAEVRPVGFAVHDGGPVLVNGAAIVRDVHVAQTETVTGGDAGLPRLLNGRNNARDGEVTELGVLHVVALGRRVRRVAVEGRAVVRVRDGHDDVLGVHVRKRFLKGFTQREVEVRADPDRVKSDENHRRAAAFLNQVEKQDVRLHRRVGPFRNARVVLARQRDRPVRSNIDRNRADVETVGLFRESVWLRVLQELEALFHVLRRIVRVGIVLDPDEDRRAGDPLKRVKHQPDVPHAGSQRNVLPVRVGVVEVKADGVLAEDLDPVRRSQAGTEPVPRVVERADVFQVAALIRDQDRVPRVRRGLPTVAVQTDDHAVLAGDFIEHREQFRLRLAHETLDPEGFGAFENAAAFRLIIREGAVIKRAERDLFRGEEVPDLLQVRVGKFGRVQNAINSAADGLEVEPVKVWNSEIGDFFNGFKEREFPVRVRGNGDFNVTRLHEIPRPQKQ